MPFIQLSWSDSVQFLFSADLAFSLVNCESAWEMSKKFKLIFIQCIIYLLSMHAIVIFKMFIYSLPWYGIRHLLSVHVSHCPNINNNQFHSPFWGSIFNIKLDTSLSTSVSLPHWSRNTPPTEYHNTQAGYYTSFSALLASEIWHFFWLAYPWAFFMSTFIRQWPRMNLLAVLP